MNSSGSLLVTEALIIDEPWVTKIFRGEKTWELRSRHTYKRGWIGLIRKGSGKVIGVANLTESRGPVPIGEMKAARALHQSATVSNTSRYRYAWVLADARPLDVPVAYRHPAGAVIWVRLAPSVTEEIERQCRKPRSARKKRRPLGRESEAAEKWLADRFERTIPPTKYKAGFRVNGGRELALDRCCDRIRIWVANFSGPVDGVRVLNPVRPGLTYSADQARSSNIKACAPTLAMVRRMPANSRTWMSGPVRSEA